MSSAFVGLRLDSLHAAVAGLLRPRIEAILDARGQGHCMRVSDLDDQVMEAVCAELHRARPNDSIFILGSHEQEEQPFRVTSTKLVELRNPDEAGQLRPPLLVFVPASLRTSAEDSFGVATFEEVSFSAIYEELVLLLLDRLPAPLAARARDLFEILAEEKWTPADDVARARCLLTALENGADEETLGASLYELSLVPDFRLPADAGLAAARIRRNVRCVRQLIGSYRSLRGRIAELGLGDRTLEARLLACLEEHGVQEPETWTAAVAMDRNWWCLSFDKWTFREDVTPDKIALSVLGTDLPIVSEGDSASQLSGLVGQQVLAPRDRRTMKVEFEVSPCPSKVNGLDHFTVQIVSRNGGPVGRSKKVKAWKPNRQQGSCNLSKLDQIEFEEGWHVVRVLPWTADGGPIALDAGSSPESDRRPWESEPFYVLPDGSIGEDGPPPRTVPVEQSLEHARFRLQFAAVGEGSDPDEFVPFGVPCWTGGENARKGVRQDMLLAQFSGGATVQIPVSRMLKVVEQQILANPTHLSCWRMRISADAACLPEKAELHLPSSSAMASFLAAREELFAAARKDSDELTMQGFSFRDVEKECLNYAETFLDLVRSLLRQAETTSGIEQQQHLQVLRSVLALDSVHVVATDFRGRSREAVLVPPTHPARTLWLSSWTALGKEWLDRIKAGGKEHVQQAKKALLEELTPLAHPVGMPVGDGRIFPPVDNLNAFWALHAPTTETNARGLMAEVCSALGLPEPATGGGADISGRTIADKMERYLQQHPYVRELSINVFNPGTGALVADALLSLQKKRERSDLRYDVRLFAFDPDLPSLGESLEAMMQSGTVVVDEADAFSASTGSHLFSKLKLARHGFDEFHANAKDFPAHVSILLDVFPAETLSIAEVPMGIPPIHGLIQDFDTEFVDDESGIFWSRRPVVGPSPNAEGQAACFDLLSSMSRQLCHATSAVATSGASFKAVPVVTLALSASQRELIYEIHQISDWVFTIDRSMGMEFFDHGGRRDRPDYLVDYVPGAGFNSTRNLIVSSRSAAELEIMLAPVLREHGLPTDHGEAVRVLASLRSLSGQLALKMLSSALAQQSEVLALALAWRHLEHQGALRRRILVPLDAHAELFPDGESDLVRTALALFDFELFGERAVCTLIEAGCCKQPGSSATLDQLKEQAASRLGRCEQVLRQHFDPELKEMDRPDRLLKNHELARILGFHLDRSRRHGIVDADAGRAGRLLLESVEQGILLQFRRCVLLFDAYQSSSDSSEDGDVAFHHIGRELVCALLAQGASNIPEAVVEARRAEKSTNHDSGLAVAASDEPSPAAVPPLSTGALPAAATVVHDAAASEKLLEEAAGQEDQCVQSMPMQNPASAADVGYDVMLGVNGSSPQYGLLGEDAAGRKIALDLNHTHTISLFGVQGGGKSYTLGTVMEMASMPLDRVNVLPSPLATVIFHYSPTLDYAPEFTSMINANSASEEVCMLRERYNAHPEAMKDLLILVPANKADERRAEHPEIEVRPIAFSAAELKASHWKFLMGAVGSQSMYMRQMNLIMRGLRDNLTLEALREGVERSGMSEHLKELALMRLSFAREYIDDGQRLQDLVRPGRLVIVDLRDEYIEKDEALGLFIVMLQIFSEATCQGRPFNKLVVFDEAHKYIENDDLVSSLVEVVREMRHKGTSIMVASQDPPSVPVSLIELSSQIIMHKFNSPAWLKHIQKANAALGELNSVKMSHLGAGEAYVWSSKASDSSFTRGAVRINCRPRITQHGGSTKTAVRRRG